MSRMPPRSENSPGNCTAVVFWKPARTSQPDNSSSETCSPTRNARVCRANASRDGTGCKQRLNARQDELRAEGHPGRLRLRIPRQHLEQPHAVALSLVLVLLVGWGRGRR